VTTTRSSTLPPPFTTIVPDDLQGSSGARTFGQDIPPHRRSRPLHLRTPVKMTFMGVAPTHHRLAAPQHPPFVRPEWSPYSQVFFYFFSDSPRPKLLFFRTARKSQAPVLLWWLQHVVERILGLRCRKKQVQTPSALQKFRSRSHRHVGLLCGTLVSVPSLAQGVVGSRRHDPGRWKQSARPAPAPESEAMTGINQVPCEPARLYRNKFNFLAICPHKSNQPRFFFYAPFCPHRLHHDLSQRASKLGLLDGSRFVRLLLPA
jgi:hypothetical protein